MKVKGWRRRANRESRTFSLWAQAALYWDLRQNGGRWQPKEQPWGPTVVTTGIESSDSRVISWACGELRTEDAVQWWSAWATPEAEDGAAIQNRTKPGRKSRQSMICLQDSRKLLVVIESLTWNWHYYYQCIMLCLQKKKNAICKQAEYRADYWKTNLKNRRLEDVIKQEQSGWKWETLALLSLGNKYIIMSQRKMVALWEE